MKSDHFRSGKTLAVATASKARLTVAAPPLIVYSVAAEQCMLLAGQRSRHRTTAD